MEIFPDGSPSSLSPTPIVWICSTFLFDFAKKNGGRRFVRHLASIFGTESSFSLPTRQPSSSPCSLFVYFVNDFIDFFDCVHFLLLLLLFLLIVVDVEPRDGTRRNPVRRIAKKKCFNQGLKKKKIQSKVESWRSGSIKRCVIKSAAAMERRRVTRWLKKEEKKRGTSNTHNTKKKEDSCSLFFIILFLFLLLATLLFCVMTRSSCPNWMNRRWRAEAAEKKTKKKKMRRRRRRRRKRN